MSLLIVGSVALDTLDTPEGKMDDALGGSATYFSIASRLFGADVSIVAVVGEDFPQKHLKMFEEKGVNVDGLRVTKGKTFRWSGRYDESFGDPETLDTQLNVFEAFSPELPEHYRRSDFVFLGNIDPTLQNRVVDQIESPRLIAADTMNFWIEGKREELGKLLSRVDLLLINALEVRLLSDERSLLAGARKVLEMGPDVLIVKRGEFGSMLITKDDLFVLPAYPIDKVKDPTGAGDSFGGGFMGYLAHRGETNLDELRRALVAGTVTASFDVEGFGVERLVNVTPEDIRKRMAHFREITDFTVPEL